MFEDITTLYHVESLAERQVVGVANDEIRMTKLEGMTNDLTANFFCFGIRAFELISSFGIRASSFCSGHWSSC